MPSQMSWLLIGGEDIRKIFGKRRQGFGNCRESSARQEEKKRGGVDGGKARKNEGGVGG